jgi:hypothetical protein
MGNQCFYTIVDGEGNFLNSNLMRDHTSNVIEAIKFFTFEEVKDYMKYLREDKAFKIAKVECSISEINS